MAVFKNKDNGSWYVMTRYTDWKGERKQKCKRGFATKKEATEWERIFHMQKASDLDMPFEAFVELYINDMKSRLKENTWLTRINKSYQRLKGEDVITTPKTKKSKEDRKLIKKLLRNH